MEVLGQPPDRPGRRRAAVVATAVAAVVVLTAVWLFAVEAWRARWPGMLIAFIVVAWPLVVAAWRPFLPAGWRWTLALAALLVWIDLLVDWWFQNPADLELAAPLREVGKVAGVVAASLLAARLPASTIQRGARAFLVALSSSVAVLLAVLVLFVAIGGGRDDSRRADAALVLGYALAPDGSPQPSLIARVDRAAELHKAGLAPRLVLSGGAARARKTEAGVMRELLIERGVPNEAIQLDIRARTTEENFACAMPILAGEPRARTVLLVTEPWHMRRALYQARRYQGDIELLPAPASASPEWQEVRKRSRHLFAEAVAYVFEPIRRIGGEPAVCPP
jgi:uncharacterized SAM-binding protein YcdF (DUF218 family)